MQADSKGCFEYDGGIASCPTAITVKVLVGKEQSLIAACPCSGPHQMQGKEAVHVLNETCCRTGMDRNPNMPGPQDPSCAARCDFIDALVKLIA